MEFFLPSILVLIISGIVVFAILPRLAPIIILIISFLLLMYAMRQHYLFFSDEYRNLTWYEPIKAYGPGIMYGILVIFMIGFIFSFFKGGQVPVPEAPSMPELATPNILNTMKNTTKNLSKSISNSVTNVANNLGSLLKNVSPSNRNGNKVRSSFFEEI